jgi:hypothetical protein
MSDESNEGIFSDLSSLDDSDDDFNPVAGGVAVSMDSRMDLVDDWSSNPERWSPEHWDFNPIGSQSAPDKPAAGKGRSTGQKLTYEALSSFKQKKRQTAVDRWMKVFLDDKSTKTEKETAERNLKIILQKIVNDSTVPIEEMKDYLVPNKPPYHCEHNKRPSNCEICHGSSICKHNKNKHICKECKADKSRGGVESTGAVVDGGAKYLTIKRKRLTKRKNNKKKTLNKKKMHNLKKMQSRKSKSRSSSKK